MIALEELKKVKKTLVMQRSDVRKTLYNTESYATRLKVRLKDIDESINKVDKEYAEFVKRKEVTS